MSQPERSGRADPSRVADGNETPTRKSSEGPLARRIKWVLLVIILVVVGGYATLIGFLVVVPVATDYLTRTSFDPVAWRDPARVRTEIRLRMIDDFLDQQELVGKTGNDVLKLLGSADGTGYFSEWDLTYWLGRERGGFGIDNKRLVFLVDSHGTVEEVRIATD